jgi:hypothetical protein
MPANTTRDAGPADVRDRDPADFDTDLDAGLDAARLRGPGESFESAMYARYPDLMVDGPIMCHQMVRKSTQLLRDKPQERNALPGRSVIH